MSEQTNHTYDVFISYSHADKEWVRGWLLPRLETVGLRVCMDFRDFKPGLAKLINIEDAVKHSRKTLIVLTPEWVTDEWKTFESLLIQTPDPAGRERRTIPLRLKECKLPDRIEILTSVDFTKESEVELEFMRLVFAIIDVGDLVFVNRRVQQLKKLHHHLQAMTVSLNTFQSHVGLARQVSSPPSIGDLYSLWTRQCLRESENLREILEEAVDSDIGKVIGDMFQSQRNLEEALKDKGSTLTFVYGLVGDVGIQWMKRLHWADTELLKAAHRLHRLSDRLMPVILTMGVKHDSK